MLIFSGSSTALSDYYRNRRIQAITTCAMACQEAAEHCRQRLVRHGSTVVPLSQIHDHATDCGEVCELASALATRRGPLATLALTLCAELCLQLRRDVLRKL